jgi:hypothetical protein
MTMLYGDLTVTLVCILKLCVLIGLRLDQNLQDFLGGKSCASSSLIIFQGCCAIELTRLKSPVKKKDHIDKQQKHSM